MQAGDARRPRYRFRVSPSTPPPIVSLGQVSERFDHVATEWTEYDLFLSGIYRWTASTVCGLLSESWRAEASPPPPMSWASVSRPFRNASRCWKRSLRPSCFCARRANSSRQPEAHRVYDLARQLLHHFEQARERHRCGAAAVRHLALERAVVLWPPLHHAGRRRLSARPSASPGRHPLQRPQHRFHRTGHRTGAAFGPVGREFAGCAAHLYGAALSCRNAGISTAPAAAR